MQLAALLGFPAAGWLRLAALLLRWWLRVGLGVVLSQLYCSPLVFFFVPVQLPLRGSAPLQGGLVCLSPVCWSTLWCGWRGLAATFSSVPLRCFPWCRYIGFSGLLLSACLLGWLWLCTLCQGVPVAVLSAWFVGGVPLLPFPYLRWVYFWLRCLQSLWATMTVSAALRGSSSSSSVWWSISFFLELGWFLVTRWWLLLRLLVLVSSDARSHIPDAFTSSSTPISGSWMVLAPGFSCALPWVRPSRIPCWLLARDTWGFSLVVLPP